LPPKKKRYCLRDSRKHVGSLFSDFIRFSLKKADIKPKHFLKRSIANIYLFHHGGTECIP
jgi:hypothetical protein